VQNFAQGEAQISSILEPDLAMQTDSGAAVKLWILLEIAQKYPPLGMTFTNTLEQCVHHRKMFTRTKPR